MRVRRALMVKILAWALIAPAAADGLVAATDLAADGRDAARAGVPVLILYSSPSCHYCDRVKAEYLVPMHRDPAFAQRVRIREVSVGMSTPLTDFAGTQTTEGAFAAAEGVFMVPTVKVYTPAGQAVGDALVGLLSADYYYGYLLQAIDAGQAAMRPATP